MRSSKFELPWLEIDTVLVDMDGTLLDLAFDNFFWLELVPARYAEKHGLDEQRARDELKQRYDAVTGSLPWYCIDHWTRELDIDIRTLKRNHSHLIRYLPAAEEFLTSVKRRGKRLVLLTNAHQVTLAVKVQQTGLDMLVDDLVSSHDHEAPKESEAFWISYRRVEPFDPDRTLLIEDSLSVLEAARRFGLRHTVAIRRPDSRLPAREVSDFDAIDGVGDLI